MFKNINSVIDSKLKTGKLDRTKLEKEAQMINKQMFPEMNQMSEAMTNLGKNTSSQKKKKGKKKK